MLLGPKTAPLDAAADLKNIELRLSGAANGAEVTLTLEARAPGTGASLGKITHDLPADTLLGNVALVSNYGAEGGRRAGAKATQAGARHRFSKWTMEGDAFTVSPAQRFGPILWSMYSLSDSRTDEGFVMKISALTGPMGKDDSQVVELHVQRGGAWQSLGEAKLDPDAWVATFRIPQWDEKRPRPTSSSIARSTRTARRRRMNGPARSRQTRWVVRCAWRR